jgi:signal transduction histidine kinase
MSTTLSNLPARLLPALAPWVVLVVGLAATAWFTPSAHREMMELDHKHFQHEADQLVSRLDARLRTYAQALMLLRVWYSFNQEKMSEYSWTNQVYSMDILRNYPGLHEVGFVEQVLDKNAPHAFPMREAHLLRMREQRGSGYGFHLPPGGIAEFSWYHMPVVWHSYSQWREDPPREYRHYGMDLNQNPDLWAAMNWALGQDRPALSGRQILEPDNPEIAGLFLFLPVYRSALDRAAPVILTPSEQKTATTPELEDDTKAWRRHSGSLCGLIFGGIDMRAFFQHHLGTNVPAVAFALFVSTNQAPGEADEQLLFDNRTHRSNQNTRTGPSPSRDLQISIQKQSLASSPLRTVRDLHIYGRVLRFVVEPNSASSTTLNQRTLWLAATFGVATTLLLSGFIAYQTRANRKEREISADLRQSQALLQKMLHERERMSRDLHDGTIQSLYAIGLGLGRMRRTLADTEERERLEGSLAELDHVVTELRSYLVTLDPGVSPAQSAATALSELIARLRQTAATELHFAAEPGVGDRWPPAAVLDLLQAAREGISNALRHGHATQVDLALEQVAQGEMHFTITDNGKGFDPSAARRQEGHGLSNLERRARAWNGCLHVQSRPGGPTCLTLTLFPFGGQVLASVPPDANDPKRERESKPANPKANGEPKASS